LEDTFKESATYHAGLLYRECENLEDAKNYLNDCIADIVIVHPHADEMEIRTLLIDALKEMYSHVT